MARTVRDTNLETRTARQRLAARPKPYWRVLEKGLHLGYRRSAAGGAWIARRFVGEGRYSEAKVGAADDMQDADGVAVRSFSQAQDATRAWWKSELRRDAGHAAETGPFTVADALDAYFAERERRGSKALDKDRAAARARIRPTLGEVEVAKLTTKRIRDWHGALVTARGGLKVAVAEAGKLVEAARAAKAGQGTAAATEAAGRAAEPVGAASERDATRARRATANRVLTILKAALNHAFHEGHAASDEPWRKAKPFREADAPVVRYLTLDECRRLVNAAEGSFRDLVRAALLTGCRYGELTRLRASDVNHATGTVTMRETKAGKPRHVALTDEGRALMAELTAGRAPGALVFLRDDGKAWGPSHQQRPLDAASAAARLTPPATFHMLRHTYASTLAMKGVPMGVIAAQLGHADTRITERHYAHLAPSYVADTVRAALPSFGIVERSTVTPLRAAGGVA